MTDFSHNAEENPASQATGKSMAELFATDPMELTNDEREQIIKAFRQERTKFLNDDSQKSTKQTKGAASKQASVDLDINDIDI